MTTLLKRSVLLLCTLYLSLTPALANTSNNSAATRPATSPPLNSGELVGLWHSIDD